MLLDRTPSSEGVIESVQLLKEFDRFLDGVSRRVAHIPFRDPASFKVGELHRHFDLWEMILNGHGQEEKILQWIKEGANVSEFMKPFKRKPKRYDCDFPPPSPPPPPKLRYLAITGLARNLLILFLEL